MDDAWQVQDEDRTIEFRGERLAKSSSWSQGKLRWTEVEIYRTTSGRYIVATIGRTDAPEEETFYRASVSETARGVVEALHQLDDGGVRYLTWTARQALDDASRADNELSEAYRVQTID